MNPSRRSLSRDDPSSFAAPPQFGPFRVLHQIGVGALGPVFRTYEPERDRLVAVKVFRLDITPEQSQTLADELSRAAEAGLFHPSIVEPIAAGVEGSVAYGAQEYVAAESLDVAMRHYAPAPIETVLPFITQLAGAVDFARTAGIGHGALHPRDIFVTPEEARVTGFGVVEALERVEFRAPVRRPYSPPERIAGQPWSTPADVFSLAAITYEMLTGRRPAGLGQEIGSLTAGTPNESMDALHAVLSRAMQEDPDARYPTALSFAAALEAAARGERPADMTGSNTSAHALAAGALPFRAREETTAGSPPVNGIPGADDEVEAADMPESQPDAARDVSAAASWPPQQPEAAREVSAAASWPPTQPEAARDVSAAASWPPQQPEAAREDDEDIRGEQEDDEAHHQLSLREMEERSRADTPASEAARSDAGWPSSQSEAEPPNASWPPTQPEAAREVSAAASWPPTQPEAAREVSAAASWPPAQPEAAREDEKDDRFMLDVAGAAAAPASLLDDFAPGRSDIDLRALQDEEVMAADERPSPLFEPQDLRHESPPPVNPAAAVPAYHPSFGSTATVRHRAPATGQSSSWPLVLVLVFGLLAGFGGGYWFWGRSTGGAETAASGTREFSEQAVAPAAGTSSSPSRASGSAGQPATAKPDASAASGPSSASATTPPPSASDTGRAAPTPQSATEAAKPAPPSSAGAGTIVVRSTPTGAGVTINGRWRGRTPLTLDELPYARYNVRVVQPGYAAATESVTLSSGEPSRSLSFRLRAQPAPRGAPRAGTSPAARPSTTVAGGFTGSIYVDSRPRGAQVSINGKPVGVTPLRIPNVRIGAHVVRLELPDHRIWSSSARVTAGEEARVTGSLERIQ